MNSFEEDYSRYLAKGEAEYPIIAREELIWLLSHYTTPLQVLR
jgi:hypothetical protein